jgi:hypothetical protein
MRHKSDPQEREEVDLTSLPNDVAPIDYAKFGRKLAEIITEAVKASTRRREAANPFP